MMINMKVIYFDTETTGLKCSDCQIIELAMITVIDGEKVEEYDKFIKVDGNLIYISYNGNRIYYEVDGETIYEYKMIDYYIVEKTGYVGN